jgi:hypothetical protein
LDDIRSAMADPKAVFKHIPVDENIALNMAAVPRDEVPDLPDRSSPRQPTCARTCPDP